MVTLSAQLRELGRRDGVPLLFPTELAALADEVDAIQKERDELRAAVLIAFNVLSLSAVAALAAAERQEEET